MYQPDRGETASEVTREALIRDHNQRNTPGPKIPMPQGERVSADPYIGARYPGEDSTLLLGAPYMVLKDPKPGHMYLWRIRDQARTGAMIRSGVIRPVEMDEIDEDCSLAEVVELVTAKGTFVVWETHALFEMPPEHVERYYTGYENYAVGRLATHAAQFNDEIASNSRGAYEGIIQKGRDR